MQTSVELQKLAPVLGEITLLMKSVNRHRYLFLGELDWLVIAPMLNNQFHIFRNNGEMVGFICWAKVNRAVDTRLRSGVIKLMENEWDCGDIVWVIDTICSEEYTAQMQDYLKTNILPNETINVFAKTGEKTFECRTI